MLKKETLRTAIDAICARDPEIGYSLNELLHAGRIDVVRRQRQGKDSGYDGFVFNGRRVPVRKADLFIEGAAAVEQSLLIQYGEMEEKQRLAASKGLVSFSGLAAAVQTAGLARLARHEIDRAVRLLEGAPPRTESGLFPNLPPLPPPRMLLETLRRETPGKVIFIPPDDPRILFSGAVDADTPAYFTSFPFTFTALMQTAGLDLPYFSIRFLLDCLIAGKTRNLFACIVDSAITGLVYLKGTRRFLVPGLEIDYIASAGAPGACRNPPGPNRPAHRGVGTFLVAGVWMLWKHRLSRVREISLNAEIQALGFYEQIGFEKRRPYVYTLKHPAGWLLNVLAVMADRSRFVSPAVIEEILGFVRTQIRRISRLPEGETVRNQSLSFIKLCLLSRTQPRLARTAGLLLLEHRARIPEAEGLLNWAASHGRIRLVDRPAPPPLLVFRDASLNDHLRGVFHLENARRLGAIEAVLEAPLLKGKWTGIPGRMASDEELAWVHTHAYISKISATAGAPLRNLDLDTQTTAASWDVARRAVGGVFSLLDDILASPSRRGFAAVRPPGHHAEPERAMGFCIFNNAALGACYLKHAKGLARVMIVDIDAHHGNGTQTAFYDSRDVLYVSMHQFPCYPGTGNFGEVGEGDGEGYSVNIPLAKGMGDREFVQVIDRLVDPLACGYEPEMILVSCGFDLYRHDRLAQLVGTPDGYAMITRLLCRIADLVCGGRIAFIMEGGYSIKGIEACGAKVIQELCSIPAFDRARLEKILSDPGPPFTSLQKVITLHRKYWSILNL